jgi:hypothetical protein
MRDWPSIVGEAAASVEVAFVSRAAVGLRQVNP